MALARQDYIAPWWTYWLHNFPHLNLNFQPVDNTFRPEEASYQQVSDVMCPLSFQTDRHMLLSTTNFSVAYSFTHDTENYRLELVRCRKKKCY